MLTLLAALRRTRLSGAESGFTLLELLIVVIVIGILAAIALPVFLTQQAAAYDASAQSDVRNTVSQVVAFEALNRSQVNLTAAGYVEAGGKLVVSPHSHVGLVVGSAGSYTVCGWSDKGDKYKSAATAWQFSSLTGKSAQLSIGECKYALDQDHAAPGTNSDSPLTPAPSDDPDTNGSAPTTPTNPIDPPGGTTDPTTPDPYANDPTQVSVEMPANLLTLQSNEYPYGSLNIASYWQPTGKVGATLRSKDFPLLDGAKNSFFDQLQYPIGYQDLSDLHFYQKDGHEVKQDFLHCFYRVELVGPDTMASVQPGFGNSDGYHFVMYCSQGGSFYYIAHDAANPDGYPVYYTTTTLPDLTGGYFTINWRGQVQKIHLNVTATPRTEAPLQG